MELAWATVTWLLLGLPVGLVFLMLRRIELCIGVLPFAGCLALVLPLIISAWTGSALSGQAWKSLLASIVLAGITAWLLRADVSASRSLEPAPRTLPTSTLLIALIPLLGIAGYNIYVGAVLSHGPPTYSWDAYQMWLVHTKVLAHGDVFPAELFSEPQLERSQWQYPLLLPATLAWMMRQASLGVHELHLAAGILIAVFPIATFSVVLRWLPPLLAASLALLPLIVRGVLHAQHQVLADPLLVMTSMTGYASVIIAMVRNDRPLLVVGGLVLASSVAVKVEGVFWVAACAGCAGLLGMHLRFSIKKWMRTLGAVVIPSLLVFSIWELTCRRLGAVTSVPLETADFFMRVPVVLESIAAALFRGPSALLVPLCMIATPILVPGSVAVRARVGLILLSLPGLYLASVVAIQSLIGIPPPYDIHWLVQTSIYRLTFGVLPALFFGAVVAAMIRLGSARAKDLPETSA